MTMICELVLITDKQLCCLFWIQQYTLHEKAIYTHTVAMKVPIYNDAPNIRLSLSTGFCKATWCYGTDVLITMFR